MGNIKPFPNKTAEFFYKLCKLTFFCGLPNFWVEKLHMSDKFLESYRFCSRIIGFSLYVLVGVEWAAFFTKQHLTDKQKSDLMNFGISHPMLLFYGVALSHQKLKINKILFEIVELTKVFNDTDVENSLLRKSKLYSFLFVSSCVLAVMMYSIDALLQLILKGNRVKGATYTTIITAWPEVENNSIQGNIVRVVWNVLWWELVARALAVYSFVICLITCMTHQFMQLRQYFLQLDHIFNTQHFNQTQKELDYEKGFKVGIDFYKNTLQVVHLSKDICGGVMSCQIIFNVTLVVINMAQLLNSDRTLVNTFAICLSTSGILLASGLFMCNAGDVTVEASHLAEAMYMSGWHHCQGPSSVRVRKLVVSSMMAAQKPVIIKGLYILDLSYQTFVSLVKSTYSLFTLIY